MPNEFPLMHNTHKAAILLLSLDQSLAAQVLGHLPRELVERATLAVAEAEEITLDQQNAVLMEFQSQFHSQPRLRRGGPETARQLLAQTVGDDAAAPIRRASNRHETRDRSHSSRHVMPTTFDRCSLTNRRS